MGFKPMIFCDQAGCCNQRATVDSIVNKGVIWVFDWNRIERSHNQIMTWHILYEVTTASHSLATNHPLSQRVMG